MGHERIWGTLEGGIREKEKGKDTEGSRGSKYTACEHMKAA
jgi:hypothetical protein